MYHGRFPWLKQLWGDWERKSETERKSERERERLVIRVTEIHLRSATVLRVLQRIICLFMRSAHFAQQNMLLYKLLSDVELGGSPNSMKKKTLNVSLFFLAWWCSPKIFLLFSSLLHTLNLRGWSFMPSKGEAAVRQHDGTSVTLELHTFQSESNDAEPCQSHFSFLK